MPSHVDSDGDPPLINVTHHMQTEEEMAYDDDFDIDNLPFVCHSQPSATTCQMPEIMRKNVYEQSSSESVEVPNAQREKYNLPTDMTLSSSHNNEIIFNTKGSKFQWTTTSKLHPTFPSNSIG